MNGIELTKYNASAEWMVLVFFSAMFLVAWVKISYPKRFNRLLRTIINQQSLFQVMREELVFSHRGSIVLTIVYILISALFLSLSGRLFGFYLINGENAFLYQYLYWGILITAIYFLKFVFTGLFFLVIQKPNFYKTNMFLVSIINKITGLILLPISILAAYLPVIQAVFIIKSGVIIWIGLLFFRLVKEVLISKAYNIPSFYFILYLCAFEISPFLVGIKLVSVLNI